MLNGLNLRDLLTIFRPRRKKYVVRNRAFTVIELLQLHAAGLITDQEARGAVALVVQAPKPRLSLIEVLQLRQAGLIGWGRCRYLAGINGWDRP